MTADADVVIVGAGLAGLSAAIHLHRAGVATTVCEAAEDVGGRVRTDRRDGFLLDHGFQVLLPAYPELRRQADLSALKPHAFLRGVLAMTTAGTSWLAAPWHGQQALAGAAGFLLGHPRDSAAMAALSLRDALAPGPVIRAADPAATTMEDLRRRFSPAVIAEVFRPFLAGVFLDPALGTPARLFHLIWRCFLRGGGALPEGGMQMLPRQLAGHLPAGTLTALITKGDGSHPVVVGLVVLDRVFAVAASRPGFSHVSMKPVWLFVWLLPEPWLFGSGSLAALRTA